MSYSILYDTAFVKLSNNKYIPFVLAGSNNFYETYGRGNRRLRSWQMWLPFAGSNKLISESDIYLLMNEWRDNLIKSNDEYRLNHPEWDSIYSDKRFGYFASVCLYGKRTSTTSFNAVLNFFLRGVKNAVTYEQFTQQSLIQIRHSSYQDDKLKDLNITKETVYPSTEESFLYEFNRFHQSCIMDGVYFGVFPTSVWDDIGKILRQKFHPKQKRLPKPKEVKMVDEAYTIMYAGNYFKKRTRNYIIFSYIAPQYKFETLKQAERKLKQITRGENDSRFTIKKLNGPIQI